MKKRKIILGILLITIAISTAAQRTISGRITDAETKEPIPGASVFINGTTVGITTDTEGYYKLKIPGPGSYKLAVSHAGYQTVYKDIEPGQSAITLNIEMNYHELKETIVTAKVKYRKEDIDLFWKTILGKYPSKNTIFSANPGDVYYFIIEKQIY